MRNKNRFLLPSDGGSSSEEDSLKRKTEKDPADTSLFKRFKKGIGFGDKENLNPDSREIGSNGQVDNIQKIKKAQDIKEQLGISQEDLEKFSELGSELSKIDPTQSEEIKRTIEEAKLTPEEFQKFNQLLDATFPDEQRAPIHSEVPKVKDKREPLTDKTNDKEISDEMSKVTQEDIDKQWQKYERNKHNWETLMQLIELMQTPGNGIPSA